MHVLEVAMENTHTDVCWCMCVGVLLFSGREKPGKLEITVCTELPSPPHF